MSGGPPHHPHGRQAPSPNTAWNHLQVPNYYPRQPQHAHMSHDHPILHQSTWHTPTTEPVKSISHSHLFNLEQMISERPYPRHSPGVDLSLQRNGSQNGELPTTPLSLSVRDANKINSLPEMQAVELTKSLSPKTVLKSSRVSSVSPTVKGPVSPGSSTSPNLYEKQDSPKTIKRSTKRMDSIIERLNPIIPEQSDKPCQSSVIVQPASISGSIDENSNSGSVLNAPTSTSTRDEDVISPYSNEDSTDSNKSRRKRKPAKTMRVSKEVEKTVEREKHNVVDSSDNANANDEVKEVQQERRRSGSAPPGSPTLPPKTRRKTSSESETIANIAAMVKEQINPQTNCLSETENNAISVIKTNENLDTKADEPAAVTNVQTTLQQVKPTESNSFVEVENKLEEMFAGIADDEDQAEPIKSIPLEYNDVNKTLGLEEHKNEELTKSEASTSQINDSVTSTSNDNSETPKRSKSTTSKSQRSNDSSEVSPKRKKANKKSKATPDKIKNSSKKSKVKNSLSNKQFITKSDIKDVYAYDSGSNASSNKSRGPFVQIRGPRESPLSVNIVNTPTNEEDSDKKSHKSKKYHDDTEYRHKVRSRGLHCSTLSNKYDAQTRDATWICVFCKRGPHATDPNLAGPSRFNATANIPPPGDLFGPYVITTDSPEYQRRLDDPYDQQFRSKKVARAVNAMAINKSVAKKSKRKHSDSHDSRSSLECETSDIYLGITETKDKVYEVWAHEDCIVWSPGVYLVGPKIIGLEEAVWTSCNVVCNECRYKGANLCCIKRGCMSVMHLGCAVSSEWCLDEENYKALCPLHKEP